MVGIDSRKENSSAVDRDIPTSSPATIVDIERDVPGNTADKVWQHPIQTAWPYSMVSTSPERLRLPQISSTIHIMIPPAISATDISTRSSRCLPITFLSRNAGIAVQR